MTQATPGRSGPPADDTLDFLALGAVLLERRRLILVLGLVGAAVGFAAGMLTRRTYTSHAIIIPEKGQAMAASGLAAAASQLGIAVPMGDDAWGPPVYVELLRSRELLEPLALDTVAVTEEGGRRAAVMDLLKVQGPTEGVRLDRAVRALRKRISATEDKRLGGVRLAVTTRWASVSFHLGERLVADVNRFNLETKQSSAAAERRFVERQVADAQRALREAEDRTQAFLQANRVVEGSPKLVFERDRLQREVTLRQQVYTSLAQKLDEVRIREVRNTPVVTSLERPRLAAVGDPRGTVAKTLLGGLAGGALAVLLALMGQRLAAARRDGGEGAERFFRLLEDIAPRRRR